MMQLPGWFGILLGRSPFTPPPDDTEQFHEREDDLRRRLARLEQEVDVIQRDERPEDGPRHR